MLLRQSFRSSTFLLRRNVTGQRKFSSDQGSDDVKFEFSEPWKAHRCEGPNMYAYANRDELLMAFKQMATVRRIEIASDNLYKKKKIRGFCHLYDGQEAVCVGIENAITKNDHVITSYREHGWQFVRGDSIFSIMAEQLGKKGGSARGKGGSMHLYYPENCFYGGNGIVGAQVPLGAGIGLAAKIKGDGTVAYAVFGDGAANQGQVYESLNMCALWKVPCVFVCENNLYGMGTSTDRSSYVNEYWTRGDYVPGVLVDGMDYLKCREAARYARDWCRDGNGPMVLEYRTYRYHGHSMSDPGTTYRSREEVSDVRQRNDPIERLRAVIVDTQLATPEELKETEKEIRKEVNAAVILAEEDGVLTEEQLVLDIYSEPSVPPFVRYSNYANSVVNGDKKLSTIRPELLIGNT